MTAAGPTAAALASRFVCADSELPAAEGEGAPIAAQAVDIIMADGSVGKTAVTRGAGGSSSSPGRVPADHLQDVKRVIAFGDQGLGSSSPKAAAAAAAAGQAATGHDGGAQGVGAVGDEMRWSPGSIAPAAAAAATEAQQAAGGNTEDAILEALSERWEVQLRQSKIVKQQEQLQQESAQENKQPIAVPVSTVSQHYQLPDVLFNKYGSIRAFIATRPKLHYVAAAKPYIEVL